MNKTQQKILNIKARNTRELGQGICRLRKLNGFTQQTLGEKSVIKQEAISVLETGAEGVRLGTLFKILAALNLEIVLVERPTSNWNPEDTFK